MTESNEYSTADFVKVGEGGRGTEALAAEPPTGAAGARMAREPEREAAAALFAEDETQSFRGKWTDIQAEFVDEPKKSVEKADHLVAETIKRLAEIFAEERNKLEHEWSRGEDRVSTEDLRVALRRYRSFFDRLLSV
ncbi:MAG TPA: hypothetical protein DEQ47_03095 [Solibacterales bacterium]|nr:hypothetical protein [Bryobacterales bacterium]